MKIGPGLDPWQLQRNRTRAEAGTAMGRRGFLGTTLAAAALSAADIKDFRARLHGPLLLAQDPGYDAARRLWNPSFNRPPALIARCAHGGDVAGAANFARAQGLRTAVRDGGPA